MVEGVGSRSLEAKVISLTVWKVRQAPYGGIVILNQLLGKRKF